MDKSPDAFRTISEVADWLGTPTHVLRFWESRFTQVKPVKRAGGRRYYRPKDMALLGGIKKLLHDDGMTIRGVQKLLREKGVGHVEGLSRDLSGEKSDDAAIAEAPMVLDAKPESIENVVPLLKGVGPIITATPAKPQSQPVDDNAAVSASADPEVADKKSATVAPSNGDKSVPETPAANTEQSDDETPALVLEPKMAQFERVATPFVAETVGELEESAESPGITGVAAALRAAASADSKRNPDPEVFAELYARLRSLRGQMEHGSNPESSD